MSDEAKQDYELCGTKESHVSRKEFIDDRLFKKQSKKSKNIGFPDFHLYNFAETLSRIYIYPQAS